MQPFQQDNVNDKDAADGRDRSASNADADAREEVLPLHYRYSLDYIRLQARGGLTVTLPLHYRYRREEVLPLHYRYRSTGSSKTSRWRRTCRAR